MSFFYNIKNQDVSFIHIPKTGGKAIIKALSGFEKIPTGRPSNKYQGHFTLQETQKILSEDNSFNSSPVYFTSIRNPWDRMVSFYHYIAQKPEESGLVDIGNQINSGNVTFEKFIDIAIYGDSKVLRSQTEFLKTQNPDGKIKIIRKENLNEDLNLFLESLGVDQVINLQHINGSKHSHYRNYYKSHEIIHKVENYDIELITKYDYKF